MYRDWEGRNKSVFIHRWYDNLHRKSESPKKLLELIKNYKCTKCTTLVGDVDNWGGYEWAGEGYI